MPERPSVRWTRNPLVQLTLMRVRELVREPGVLFWIFGFPILMSVGLGLAFRTRGSPIAMPRSALQVGLRDSSPYHSPFKRIGREPRAVFAPPAAIVLFFRAHVEVSLMTISSSAITGATYFIGGAVYFSGASLNLRWQVSEQK